MTLSNPIIFEVCRDGNGAHHRQASMFPAEGPAKVKIWLCHMQQETKIKCDEAYPACRRCISTGRACDGYGVGGDGVVSAINSPKPLYIPFLISSAAEKEHFDWFRHHTMSKLPGSFNSDFWGMLLPQACLNKPSCFQRCLGLNSVHREGYRSLGRGQGNKKLASTKPANQVEIFALEHYLQAITHLQPYFSCRDRTSLRITLIVCIVFACIGFLRGNFNSAQSHVRGGLRLIADMQQLVSSKIMEVLSRLYIQINLCQPLSSHSYIAPFQIPSPHPPLQKFDSYRFAWLELDRQLHRIFHLASQARQHQRNSTTSPPFPSAMARLQQSFLVDLERWSEILKTSKESLLGNGSVEYQKAYSILGMYHTMATIKAHTCAYPEDESVFDTYTDYFLLLTEQATALCSIAGGDLVETAPPSDGISFDTSRSIVDVGCLLSCTTREGFWDVRIAATVAWRVMEVEEGDYYKSFEITGDGSLESSLLALPECYRLHDVETVYSGEPFDKVLLFCRGK
ncbi:hypothetical protein F5B21DRAFT_525445 [Xylaria acuta]|nr:hypothetical protein F5B21DRAFT_525445 [Xylaria acuta]